MQKIKILSANLEFEANIYDTPTGEMLMNALPIKGSANVWGNEIYFNVPFHAEEENNSRDVLEIGELAFWPMGDAFCIFFGKTPASKSDEPRAYSNVNVFGKITGNTDKLKLVNPGDEMDVIKVEQG